MTVQEANDIIRNKYRMDNNLLIHSAEEITPVTDELYKKAVDTILDDIIKDLENDN